MISKQEGLKLAQKHQMMFIEASAKTKEGVQMAFEELVEKVIQTPGLWEMNADKKKQGVKLERGDGTMNASSACQYC